MSNFFNRLAMTARAREVPVALRAEREAKAVSAKVSRVRSVPNWVVLTAVLLVVLWLPVTSHDWLECAGWIHVHDDSGQDAHHDAADGVCRLEHVCVLLKAPTLVTQAGFPIAPVELISAVVDFSSDPDTRIFRSTAPPGLAATWQFSRRAACLNQAPPSLG